MKNVIFKELKCGWIILINQKSCFSKKIALVFNGLKTRAIECYKRAGFISTTYQATKRMSVAIGFRFEVVTPNGFHPGKSAFQQVHHEVLPH